MAVDCWPKAPKGWLTDDVQMDGPEPTVGAKTPLGEKSGPKLFDNITDEEIDQLFDI